MNINLVFNVFFYCITLYLSYHIHTHTLDVTQNCCDTEERNIFINKNFLPI